MRSRDPYAAARIREMRIDKGWTPEVLSYEIYKLDPRLTVSGRTIRRIEQDAVIPTTRVMFGIARVFEMVPSQLWASTSPRVAA